MYEKEKIQVLKSVLELAASTYDTTVIKLLLVMAVVFFLEVIFMVLIGYVGIYVAYILFYYLLERRAVLKSVNVE